MTLLGSAGSNASGSGFRIRRQRLRTARQPTWATLRSTPGSAGCRLATVRQRCGHDRPADFVAVLLFESTSLAATYRPLYHEDVVVLRAPSLADAEHYGQCAEAYYENGAGETITSRLLHVVDVAPGLNDDLTTTADLYSRHFRDITAYRQFEPQPNGDSAVTECKLPSRSRRRRPNNRNAADRRGDGSHWSAPFQCLCYGSLLGLPENLVGLGCSRHDISEARMPVPLGSTATFESLCSVGPPPTSDRRA